MRHIYSMEKSIVNLNIKHTPLPGPSPHSNLSRPFQRTSTPKNSDKKKMEVMQCKKAEEMQKQMTYISPKNQLARKLNIKNDSLTVKDLNYFRSKPESIGSQKFLDNTKLISPNSPQSSNISQSTILENTDRSKKTIEHKNVQIAKLKFYHQFQISFKNKSQEMLMASEIIQSLQQKIKKINYNYSQLKQENYQLLCIIEKIEEISNGSIQKIKQQILYAKELQSAIFSLNSTIDTLLSQNYKLMKQQQRIYIDRIIETEEIELDDLNQDGFNKTKEINNMQESFTNFLTTFGDVNEFNNESTTITNYFEWERQIPQQVVYDLSKKILYNQIQIDMLKRNRHTNIMEKNDYAKMKKQNRKLLKRVDFLVRQNKERCHCRFEQFFDLDLSLTPINSDRTQ